MNNGGIDWTVVSPAKKPTDPDKARKLKNKLNWMIENGKGDIVGPDNLTISETYMRLFGEEDQVTLVKGMVVETFVVKEHPDGRRERLYQKAIQTFDQVLHNVRTASNRQPEHTFYLMNVTVAAVIGAKGRMP
jgi:hypothetical protein